MHSKINHPRDYTAEIKRIISETPWGFMRPEIYRERNCLLVGTMAGTECVPCDLLGLPDPPVVELDDNEEAVDACFEWITKYLDQYLQSDVVDVASACEPVAGYVCRMSAPGYMDCTDWIYCETTADVRRWLCDEADDAMDDSAIADKEEWFTP